MNIETMVDRLVHELGWSRQDAQQVVTFSILMKMTDSAVSGRQVSVDELVVELAEELGLEVTR